MCLCTELEEEAGRPEKDSKTLSSDLIEYVQHMIREHGDNYKVSETSRLPVFIQVPNTHCFLSLQAMARDEKNYYQDTPKQIRRKVAEYKRCHPEQFSAFVEALGVPRPTGL